MTRYVKTLESLGLSVVFAPQLVAFADLFTKWNASINLSAARSCDELDEHIVDSLHVVTHLTGRSRVLDVGSGGGFPVVISAICLPDQQFRALEPVHKKHAFLRTAARELDLINLESLAIRVDDHDVHDYDAATSRAVFDLREWLEIGVTLVRPHGLAVGFEAVPRTDLPATVRRHPYALAGKQRSIVIVERSLPPT
ncbi:MAG: 16S rRNA (guanine(527)-N(7))-methyltransferase RsmG [Kofleriaceae bacterium]